MDMDHHRDFNTHLGLDLDLDPDLAVSKVLMGQDILTTEALGLVTSHLEEVPGQEIIHQVAWVLLRPIHRATLYIHQEVILHRTESH